MYHQWGATVQLHLGGKVFQLVTKTTSKEMGCTNVLDKSPKMMRFEGVLIVLSNPSLDTVSLPFQCELLRMRAKFGLPLKSRHLCRAWASLIARTDVGSSIESVEAFQDKRYSKA